MSKIAKKGFYPFTGHQQNLPPKERRLVPSRDDVIAFYKTHERVSWSLTEMLDTPAEAIRIENLDESDIFVVESTMLVESNNPDYVANLLEYFEQDEHACDFVMLWAVEEWKHYYALRDYLAKVQTALRMRTTASNGGSASPPPIRDSVEDGRRIRDLVEDALAEKVGDVRESSAENWGIPLHYLPIQLVANTTLQEFITAEFYRNHARQTREPVLAKLEHLLAKDETRHEMFYEAKMQDMLAQRPELREQMIDSLMEFGMPGGYLIKRYDERRQAMEQAAFPTLSAKKGAFQRLFAKLVRMVGEEDAMRVLVDGNYLADVDESSKKRKPNRALISRLITARVAG